MKVTKQLLIMVMVIIQMNEIENINIELEIYRNLKKIGK